MLGKNNKKVSRKDLMVALDSSIKKNKQVGSDAVELQFLDGNQINCIYNIQEISRLYFL